MKHEMYIATIQIAVSSPCEGAACDWIGDSLREAGFDGHPKHHEDGGVSVGDWSYVKLDGLYMHPKSIAVAGTVEAYTEGLAFETVQNIPNQM